MNRFAVGAVGKKVEINNLPARPRLTSKEAIELSAWLLATAAPLEPGTANEVLGKFHKLVAEVGEGTDLESEALDAIED